MLEHEYKFLLTKEQFSTLQLQVQRLYPQCESETWLQSNTYYDTEDLRLHARYITLRVREIRGQLTLEKKVSQKAQGALGCAQETAWRIPALPKTIAAAQVGLPFAEHYRAIGTLKTTRRRFFLPQGVFADFDESCYFGKTDYELELEVHGHTPHDVLALLSQETTRPLGKYHRFLQARAAQG